MKKILSLLLVLIVLLTVFFFWASSRGYSESTYTNTLSYDSYPASYEAGDTLKILTYNIGYLSGMTNNLAVKTDEDFYSNNLRRAQELFNKYHPDIAGFQEIDYASARSHEVQQLDEIGKAASYHNSAMIVNWDKQYLPFPYWPPSAQYGKMLSGQATLSEFPITSNERIVMEKPESNPAYYNAFYIDRVAQVVKIDLDGIELIVINTHLEAFDTETRMKQAMVVKNIYEEYALDYPTLLIGDFNSIPPVEKDRGEYFADDTTVASILSATNIASAVADSSYLASPSSFYTFNSEKPYQRIDYIFYNSDKITPVSSKVVTEAGDISDHLPVMMEFVIN